MLVTPDNRGESLGKREILECWDLDQTLKGKERTQSHLVMVLRSV